MAMGASSKRSIELSAGIAMELAMVAQIIAPRAGAARVVIGRTRCATGSVPRPEPDVPLPPPEFPAEPPLIEIPVPAPEAPPQPEPEIPFPPAEPPLEPLPEIPRTRSASAAGARLAARTKGLMPCRSAGH